MHNCTMAELIWDDDVEEISSIYRNAVDTDNKISLQFECQLFGRMKALGQWTSFCVTIHQNVSGYQQFEVNTIRN